MAARSNTPSSIPGETELGSAAPSAGAQENRTVAVYSDAAEFDKLRQALSPVTQEAVACHDRGGNDALPGAGVIAAIVTDALPAPLELCARLSKRHPVLLLSTNSDFDFRLAAARAGVDALLSRPLDAIELVDWLENIIEQRRRRPFSVLILDDDQLLAELYAAAMTAAGMEVQVVDTATAAFERLNAALPDIILMDVQMPGADGIEIARMIRQSRRYLSVPIVFVSGERDVVRQMEARKFGGDEFVCKPVDIQHLVALVHLRAERAKLVRSIMERDSLTGLLNHSRFKERLAHELERCRRTCGEVSLAMIDLDRFKQINDTHGHLIGDRVIRALSGTLTSGLRQIDVIGRYGGEEFAIILLDAPPHLARVVVEKLRRRFSEIEFDAAGRQFRVSFSAGLAGSRAFAETESIIAAADSALYAAKRSGRNRVFLETGSPQRG